MLPFQLARPRLRTFVVIFHNQSLEVLDLLPLSEFPHRKTFPVVMGLVHSMNGWELHTCLKGARAVRRSENTGPSEVQDWKVFWNQEKTAACHHPAV